MAANTWRNYEMGFILKDTEPSPAQDSSGVRQQGDLLGPPCAASLSVSLFTTRVSYKHNCNDGLIVESAHTKVFEAWLEVPLHPARLSFRRAVPRAL